MGEHQQVPGPQMRRDVRVVDRLLGRVRDEDHDHVRRLDRSRHVHHPQARVLHEGAALGPGCQPDHHLHATLGEVQGVGMPLAAVPDDRDRLAGEGRRIRVRVVVHLRVPCRHRLIASSMDPEPRAITTAPVRTNSLMP